MNVSQEQDVELKEYHVSKFNLTIYKKFNRKEWLIPVVPGVFMLAMGVLMGLVWPEFKGLLEEGGFKELLQSGFYQALIPGSSSLDMTSFEGFWAMELLTILDFFMLFLAIFIPVRLISNEVDKNTLDISLSFPVPRWQFVLQKFLVYLTQMAIFIGFIVVGAVFSAELIGESFNYENLLLASLAIFILFFTLGAMSLLASALFLESGRSLSVAAVFVIGMWILNSIGISTQL